jgi:hypothetical protein
VEGNRDFSDESLGGSLQPQAQWSGGVETLLGLKAQLSPSLSSQRLSG